VVHERYRLTGRKGRNQGVIRKGLFYWKEETVRIIQRWDWIRDEEEERRRRKEDGGRRTKDEEPRTKNEERRTQAQKNGSIDITLPNTLEDVVDRLRPPPR
jgi:hypothetical protein